MRPSGAGRVLGFVRMEPRRQPPYKAPMRSFSALLGASCLLLIAPATLAQYGPPPGYVPPIGSQVFDISAFAGYQLNGDVATNGGNLNIGDAPAFGVALDYRLHSLGSLELMWEYTKPDASFSSFTSLYPSTGRFGAGSHYFQIGGMTVQRIGRLEPFIGLTIGALLLVPEAIPQAGGGSVNVSDSWRFATTLMLGTKVWLTPNAGLRFEARMLVPVVFNSGGYYYGAGGAGMVATGGVPALQFAFTGGLVFGK